MDDDNLFDMEMKERSTHGRKTVSSEYGSGQGSMRGTPRHIHTRNGKRNIRRYQLSEDLYEARPGRTYLGHFDIRKLNAGK